MCPLMPTLVGSYFRHRKHVRVCGVFSEWKTAVGYRLCVDLGIVCCTFSTKSRNVRTAPLGDGGGLQMAGVSAFPMCGHPLIKLPAQCRKHCLKRQPSHWPRAGAIGSSLGWHRTSRQPTGRRPQFTPFTHEAGFCSATLTATRERSSKIYEQDTKPWSDASVYV